MPQKGQITKHEWVGDRYRKKCIHCEVVRAKVYGYEVPMYFHIGQKPVSKEPPCITRKITEDGEK